MSEQPRQSSEGNVFIMNAPGATIVMQPFDLGASLFGNLNLNFRSFLGDDNLLQHIMRLSEQERGRSGTPPANEEAIKNLKIVEISDEHCKTTDSVKEYPRCSICCEDLKDKATQMPCGHLFNKECIGEWLGQHN